MQFLEKQVTGLDGSSCDPPNPCPQETSPLNDEFSSPKRTRVSATWHRRSRHLRSGSPRNRDLPSSEMPAERDCWLG